MDVDKLKSECFGKWLGIYEHFDIDVGTGKHQPCPACGGKDRFRLMPDGGHICNQCGGGDAFNLIGKVTGLSFPEILKQTSEIIGFIKMDSIKEKSKVDPGHALNKVWKASSKLTGSDHVSKYLHLRKIVLQPDNVRFCPKCYESDSKTEAPAMVARIQNREGRPVSLHRTYLNGTGTKKVMTATEPLVGSAIRLFQPGGQFEDGVLGVAEGVESAISAAQLYGIATWSVISASIMEKWEPPEGIKNIVIYADADHGYTGQKAAFVLANKLYSKDYLVSVEVPGKLGTDFNDVLIEASKKD